MTSHRLLAAYCALACCWNPGLLFAQAPTKLTETVSTQTLSGKYQFQDNSAGLEFFGDRTVLAHANGTPETLKMNYELVSTPKGQTLKLTRPTAARSDAAIAEVDIEIRPDSLVFKTGKESVTLRRVAAFKFSRSANASRAKASEARSFVGLMNRAQQAYHIENNRFGKTLPEIGLSLPQSNHYTYRSTRIGQHGIMNIAVPKQERLRGFVGIVFATPEDGTEQLSTIAVICETEQPLPPTAKFSPIPPQRPMNTSEKIQCPKGTQLP